MNLRSFLKSIPLAFGIPLVFDNVTSSEANVPQFKYSEVPAPIEKVLEFTKNGLNYRITITDQIIITNPDGTIEMNVYGDQCRIVCKVCNGEGFAAVGMKVQSEAFLKKYVDKMWDKYLPLIVQYVEENFSNKATTSTKPFKSITI